MTVTDSELIDALGGTSKVSIEAGVTAAAVSQWRKKGMPRAWRKLLEMQLNARDTDGDAVIGVTELECSPTSN